ncbi:hypothetical protein FS749_010566 [Ceratobasidium sp. UAMH 11750]|nr:hypothetical protein FS749_010566 [Ceratobasidium sp. UAMH 11750]
MAHHRRACMTMEVVLPLSGASDTAGHTGGGSQSTQASAHDTAAQSGQEETVPETDDTDQELAEQMMQSMLLSQEVRQNCLVPGNVCIMHVVLPAKDSHFVF